MRQTQIQIERYLFVTRAVGDPGFPKTHLWVTRVDGHEFVYQNFSAFKLFLAQQFFDLVVRVALHRGQNILTRRPVICHIILRIYRSC